MMEETETRKKRKREEKKELEDELEAIKNEFEGMTKEKDEIKILMEKKKTKRICQ